MVDFVKIVIPVHDRHKVLICPLLEFEATVNTSTGQTRNVEVAKLKNLEFLKWNNSDYLELRGSLHKFFNDGQHNANDFGLVELFQAINQINSLTGLDIASYQLKNIEIGLNIEPKVKTSLILNNLIHHRLKKFKDVEVKEGNYKQVSHQRYLVKCYDKKLQFSEYVLDNIFHLMRFELKFIKMIDLNNAGIYCLCDIFDKANIEAIRGLILKEWRQVMLFDTTISKKRLKGSYHEKKYYQWKDYSYWQNLSKQRRTEQKKLYNKIVDQYSDNIHNQIEVEVIKKWSYLENNSLPYNQRILRTHLLPSNLLNIELKSTSFILSENENFRIAPVR